MYNKRKYLKANDKKVLHKVKKQWVTISLALLMAIGGEAIATHTINADTTLHSTGSTINAVNIQSTLTDPNDKMDEENPALTHGSLMQNYHYNNPSGISNDLQSIIPHYTNGHIDYWNGYYLWSPKAIGGQNEWYKYETNDFSHFNPANSLDPVSTKNVAIPDKQISVDNQNHPEVLNNNTDPIPWNCLASGSVISNNSKFNGQSWLSHDAWGNTINPNASLAYFSTFSDDTSNNGSYLAYSNDNQQFHPYGSNDVFDATTVGDPNGTDFRDPYITTCDNGHKMVAYVAGGTHRKVYILTSTDGVHWQHQPNLDINTANIPEFSDNSTETPYISKLNNTPIMFFSSQKYPETSHEMVGYVTGHFNSDGVFQPNTDSKTGLIDQGFDNYAGNFTPIDNNHLVYIGWYGNWAYFWNNHVCGFTLPKILSWNGNHIEATPIEPGSKSNISISNLTPNTPVQYQANGKVSLNFQSPTSNFDIHLNRSNNVNMDLSFNNGTMVINRTDDFNNKMNMSKSVQISTNNLSNIQLYLDNASVGIYIPETHQVFSNLTYDNTINEPYTLKTNEPAQVMSYTFNLSQAPTLDNINNINNEYTNDKSKMNTDLNIIGSHVNNSVINSKDLLDNYFDDISKSIDNANNNINQANNYAASNDSRGNIFVALANNDMSLANTKLYQANIQLNNLNNIANSLNPNTNLSNDYSRNDEAFDISSNSFTNIDGFLTANSWYRPKAIHQNGNTWRVSQQTNSTDYHDFRPVLMHWWPTKKVQVDYLNYMHQHGLTSQSYNISDSQNDLDQAANDVQDNIEKQINQNNNNGMNDTTKTLFNNFINSEPQWNILSEDPQYGWGNLQGGSLLFGNSSLTPYANSNYRLIGRDGFNRQHNNHTYYELLLGNDIDNSNPIVQAEDLNNLYYIIHIGQILANNPKGNFDGIRNDATGSMDYDWTQLESDFLNDTFHMNNDKNADDHLNILEDTIYMIDNTLDNHMRGLTMYNGFQNGSHESLNSAPNNRSLSLSALINDPLVSINRADDYADDSNDHAIPNYEFFQIHDNGTCEQVVPQLMKQLFNSHPNMSYDDAFNQASAEFDNDIYNTNKKYLAYNVPSSYALLLTNKDTVPRVWYGNMFFGNDIYMQKKTPYYDSIAALLKARMHYVSGGQQMRMHGNDILSSVRFGKGIMTPNSTISHNNPAYTEGIGTLLSNNPNLSNTSVTINMGKAHANQLYRPLLLSTPNLNNGLTTYNNDNDTNIRIRTDNNGNLTINNVKGESTPDVSGYLSVWVPVGNYGQDARTKPSTTIHTDGNTYHSNSALDSHVMFESSSVLEPMNSHQDQEMAKHANWFKSLGLTDVLLPPHYVSVNGNYSSNNIPNLNDHSAKGYMNRNIFADEWTKDGYAFSDRYNLGLGNDSTKYGNVHDMINTNIALHNQGIHTMFDLIDNQLYGLNGQEIVPVSRVNGFNNYDSSANINNKLYDVHDISNGHDYQAQYGGKFLPLIKKEYPDLFNMTMVSNGQKVPANKPLTQWSAKYLNGTNIQGRGIGYVLHDLNNKYYMVNNTGHSYVPTVFASTNQQTDDNYAQAGASAADAQIAQQQKASVANSVAQANQKAAQNAANAADQNIIDQQKASVTASVNAANQQKANQAAQQANQRIAQQQRTSVANSVAAANRARANHAAQIADQNILNQQKQSVANSVNAANQSKATSAANSADKNIESSIANSYAKSADNSIVASYKNSASASVSAVNSSYAKTAAGKAAAKSGASSADKSIESSIASSYAKSADTSIANSYKNSVNNSVEAANQSKANSAAKSADTSLANSAAKSTDNSIESSIANSYANSANNSISNSVKNSINNSVNAANQSKANSAANSANASIANSYRNSVNASVSSANQSKANSAKASADQSIENSEAKNAQDLTPASQSTPVTPSPAPFVPMFNPVTPSSETNVSNSSASSTVMPTSESASESNISNKTTKPVTHHNNTHKIALVGVNKRAYFTGKHFEAKFTPKIRKHATVLEAVIKSNHSVAYKVRVGKHVGYIYGYLTKLSKPSFFMYKNHAYIHFSKKAIRIYTKNFKFIRINKSIQYNNHKYIRYDVTYGKKHGVMYGKLPVVKKVSHSKYYQLMPKHYHYAKVIKPLCIYNSKYFSKRTRRGVISKGITVRIKRVVKADKTTRFELTNGKFITGLRSFTKLV